MTVLLEWGAKKDKEYQMRFADFYHFNKIDVINDEMLGGKIDESIITSKMMMMLIRKFELGNSLIPTFSEKEIYQ